MKCKKDRNLAGIAAMAQMLEGLGTPATAPRLLAGVFLWDRCGFLVIAMPCLVSMQAPNTSAPGILAKCILACLAVTTKRGTIAGLKAHLVVLHRFRGTAELFGEFEDAAAHQAQELMPGAPQGTLAGPVQREKARSAQEISALIRAAAAYVLGSPVGDDEPLSGAGLDSLGEKGISHFA